MFDSNSSSPSTCISVPPFLGVLTNVGEEGQYGTRRVGETLPFNTPRRNEGPSGPLESHHVAEEGEEASNRSSPLDILYGIPIPLTRWSSPISASPFQRTF